MSASPLVSILIPVYNAERFVSNSIESVISQTYPLIEIVVVDDGSTDRSAEIINSYSGRIKIILQNNAGQSEAANRAFGACSGELIKFFDADDVMAPDLVARQVERLDGRRDAVAMGEWTRFYGPMPSQETFPTLPMYRDADPVDWLVSEWKDAQPMMQCGLWLVPREIINAAGLWDPRLSLINDFEFFSRVLLNSAKILYTPNAKMYYRSGIVGTLSGMKTRSAVESQFLSLNLGADNLLSKEYSSRTRQSCANILKSFDFEHYPLHSDLRARIRRRVGELGGSDLDPIGPPGFHSARRLVGWRIARHAQHLAERWRRYRVCQ